MINDHCIPEIITASVCTAMLLYGLAPGHTLLTTFLVMMVAILCAIFL
jgi:hypothetical protein